MAWKRPQARTPGKSRPARWAAFLQHDFYPASALAVDVCPAAPPWRERDPGSFSASAGPDLTVRAPGRFLAGVW